jgi:hypothetical protein
MKIFYNQLDAATCHRIHDFATNQILCVDGNKPPVRMWTNYAWPASIIKDSSPVLCFVMPEEFLEEIQGSLIRAGVFDPEIDSPLLNGISTCLIYVWTPNSYIPLHRDGDHRKTMTIYCNEEWSYEMGGVFQWFDYEFKKWESLIPSCGTIIFNDRDEPHATTPVKTRDQFRISVQIFVLPKKPK